MLRYYWQMKTNLPSMSIVLYLGEYWEIYEFSCLSTVTKFTNVYIPQISMLIIKYTWFSMCSSSSAVVSIASAVSSFTSLSSLSPSLAFFLSFFFFFFFPDVSPFEKLKSEGSSCFDSSSSLASSASSSTFFSAALGLMASSKTSQVLSMVAVGVRFPSAF